METVSFVDRRKSFFLLELSERIVGDILLGQVISLESVLVVGGRLWHDGQGGEGLSKACLDSHRTPPRGSCPGIASNVGGHDGPGRSLCQALFTETVVRLLDVPQYDCARSLVDFVLQGVEHGCEVRHIL